MMADSDFGNTTFQPMPPRRNLMGNSEYGNNAFAAPTNMMSDVDYSSGFTAPVAIMKAESNYGNGAFEPMEAESKYSNVKFEPDVTPATDNGNGIQKPAADAAPVAMQFPEELGPAYVKELKSLTGSFFLSSSSCRLCPREVRAPYLLYIWTVISRYLHCIHNLYSLCLHCIRW
jgi:hypothetical protein